MTALARQVCLNHPVREAVARCVECHRFFCRECIAEHDGRLICASCLAKLARPAARSRAWPGLVRGLVKGAAGFLFAWILFYTIGNLLLQLPSTFHEDTFWNATWQKLNHATDDD
jgi:hypothetical protein